jgi:hypothetical protein
MVAWLIIVYTCAGAAAGCPHGNVITTYTAMQPSGGVCSQAAAQILAGTFVDLGKTLEKPFKEAKYKMVVPPTCVLAPAPSWLKF